MFGIGVCFHIGHSDQILSAKDWESSKYWCLIFVSQMRIISYIVGEAAVQSVLIRKKKEISDRDKELNNIITAARGSVGNTYYKGCSSSAWDQFFPLPSKVPLN